MTHALYTVYTGEKMEGKCWVLQEINEFNACDNEQTYMMAMMDSMGEIDGQKTMAEQWQEHKPKKVQKLSLEFVSWWHAHHRGQQAHMWQAGNSGWDSWWTVDGQEDGHPNNLFK